MKKETITIKEDVRVPGTEVILEAGDQIEVLPKIEEMTTSMARNHVVVQDVIDAVNDKFGDDISIVNQRDIPTPRWLYTGASYSFFLAEGTKYVIDGLAENRVPITMSITKIGHYVKTIYLEDGLSGILSQIK